MKELKDGRWQIDSAFEAERIGRLAAYPSGDLSDRILLKHHGDLPETHDEAEFFNRTMQYGALVISSSLAQRAEQGLHESIVLRLRASEKETLIPRKEAMVFLAILALSREVSPPPPKLVPTAA